MNIYLKFEKAWFLFCPRCIGGGYILYSPAAAPLLPPLCPLCTMGGSSLGFYATLNHALFKITSNFENLS